MRQEFFKGVIWPRGIMDIPGGKVHRYVVVGILVTGEPIPEFDGKNEVILSGSSGFFAGLGLADTLAEIPVSETTSEETRFGDATDVLLNLSRVK